MRNTSFVSKYRFNLWKIESIVYAKPNITRMSNTNKFHIIYLNIKLYLIVYESFVCMFNLQKHKMVKICL